MATFRFSVIPGVFICPQTFLNDKYGEPFVPTVIQQHELDRIMDTISLAHQRELEEAAAKAAAAEAAVAAAAAAAAERSAAEVSETSTGTEPEVNKHSRRVPVITPDDTPAPSVYPSPRRASKQLDSSELAANKSIGPTPPSTTGSERRSSGISLLKRTAAKIGRVTTAIKGMRKEYSNVEYPDVGLLHTWYELDNNAIPPVYRLCNIRYLVWYLLSCK